MAQDIIQKLKLAWSSGGLINEVLPKEGISKVIIKHNTGTAGGGSYVANTIIEDIKLRINGKDFINWGGEGGIAGQISMGIACLREFYKQKHVVAMPAEYFIIELPDALPKGAEVQLIATMATLASAGMTTSYDGTFDVLYQMEDKILGKTVVPFITWGSWNDGADVGNLLHYLTTLPFKLRLLQFITMDATTIAVDTYDDLLMTFPANPIFNGALSSFKGLHEGNSKVALTDGHFMKSFKGGIKVPPESLLLMFYAGTAGTTKKVHWSAICY